MLTLFRHKEIVWTVEWIHPDGEHELKQCRESIPLCDAYAEILSQRRGEKRKLETARLESRTNPGRSDECKPKRRSGKGGGGREGPQLPSKPLQPHRSLPVSGDSTETKDSRERDERGEDVPTQTKEHLDIASTEGQSIDRSKPALASSPSVPATEASQPPDQVAVNNKPTSKESSGSKASDRSYVLSLHYYLLKPHTSTSSYVLIPIPPTDTLLTCLRDRVVLEFPTIYVLSEPPTALPGGFVLEETYLAQSEAEARELEELLAQAEGVAKPEMSAEGEDGESRRKDEMLIDRRILDVLKMDIGGL